MTLVSPTQLSNINPILLSRTTIKSSSYERVTTLFKSCSIVGRLHESLEIDTLQQYDTRPIIKPGSYIQELSKICIKIPYPLKSNLRSKTLTK